MVWPSRRIVMLSATRITSPSLCEMMMHVRPWSRSSTMRSSRCLLSSSLSAAVGSSRMSSFTFLDKAFAISTSCCLPTPMSAIRVRGLSASPPHAGEQPSGVGHGFVPADHPPGGGVLVAEEDVLRNGQHGNQRQFLMDDADATSLAGPDVLEVARLTVEDDLAVVAAVRVDPAQHLHQRRLPGTVLTADRVDLAGAHDEVDLAERRDPRETLGDAPHFEERSGVGDRHASCPAV